MNKIFSAAVLAAALFVFAIQSPTAEARDVYCGTYESGYDAYLMTETVRGRYFDYLSCRVKAVYGNDVIYVDYSFEFHEAGTISFENSQGYSGRFGGVLNRGGSPYPIESKVYNEANRLLQ